MILLIYYMVFGKEYMSYFHYMIFIVYNYFISHNITLQKIWYNVTKRKQNRQNGMGKSLTTVAN